MTRGEGDGFVMEEQQRVVPRLPLLAWRPWKLSAQLIQRSPA
jgi:hypothetical protein